MKKILLICAMTICSLSYSDTSNTSLCQTAKNTNWHSGGNETEFKKVINLYEQAASKGQVCGMTGLAHIYRYGQIVETDHAVSFGWARLAALHGDVESLTDIAKMYSTGRGVYKDLFEAHRIYMMAAMKGNRAAQFEVCWNFRKGDGTYKDPVRAWAWNRILKNHAFRGCDPVSLYGNDLERAQKLYETLHRKVHKKPQ